MFHNRHNPRLAIVLSQFNGDITQMLYEGALARLHEHDIAFNQENTYFVPGAVEIPVVAARLAHSGSIDAILCLGAVIRGDTNHYNYVCQQVSYGCQKVAITSGIPVIFGILTTDTEEQALERCGGLHGHKGRECVDTALEMVALMERFK